MITEKQKAKLKRQLKKYRKNGKSFYEMGRSLLDITETIANVVGDQKVNIILPYSNFNCNGSAKKIAEDVQYLTPCSGGKCWDVEHATTLFYGDKKCNNKNYLPFQSDTDVFHVQRCTYYTKKDDCIYIILEEGLSWRAFL